MKFLILLFDVMSYFCNFYFMIYSGTVYITLVFNVIDKSYFIKTIEFSSKE